MGKKNRSFDTLDQSNINIMIELIVDPNTTEALRVKILNKLLGATEAEDFFETIAKEKLDFGPCPCCGHENDWLTPEEALNRMGIATHQRDDRVKRMTTEADWPRWQQACGQKNINI